MSDRLRFRRCSDDGKTSSADIGANLARQGLNGWLIERLAP